MVTGILGIKICPQVAHVFIRAADQTGFFCETLRTIALYALLSKKSNSVNVGDKISFVFIVPALQNMFSRVGEIRDEQCTNGIFFECKVNASGLSTFRGYPGDDCSVSTLCEALNENRRSAFDI